MFWDRRYTRQKYRGTLLASIASFGSLYVTSCSGLAEIQSNKNVTTGDGLGQEQNMHSASYAQSCLL